MRAVIALETEQICSLNAEGLEGSLGSSSLWSLWDMMRFFAMSFAVALAEFRQRLTMLSMADKTSNEADAIKRLRDTTESCAQMISKFPVSAVIKQQLEGFWNQLGRAGQPSSESITICAVGMVLYNSIHTELAAQLFFVIPEDRKQWFYDENRALFGNPVDSAFPETTREIAEAGRCFALDRWTACVFHLMRATECALHRWASDLNVPLNRPVEQANWQEILDASEKKLKGIGQQPRSTQRDLDLEYFNETAVHFSYIKDAWRNHVSHSKRTYDEREAISILTHVRSFMEKLASRPKPAQISELKDSE